MINPKVTTAQRFLIIGTILGGSSIIKPKKGKNCYLSMRDKDISWLKHKADQLCRLNSDRYEALNFRNEKTIEFRLFKGTLKYETMVSCLEFAFACWHFTASASTSELTTGKFLDFICLPENRKDTRFLRAYLKEKGYKLADNLRKTIAPALPAVPEIAEV
jgi:hypothetical protein